jgi:hypothetical protein
MEIRVRDVYLGMFLIRAKKAKTHGTGNRINKEEIIKNNMERWNEDIISVDETDRRKIRGNAYVHEEVARR